MIWNGVRPLPRSARLCFPPSPSAQTKNRQSLILFTSPDCKTIPFSKNATQLNRNKSRAGSLWLITQWSWKWLLLSANILNSWKQNYIFLKILILFHLCGRHFQNNQNALLAIKLFTEQCIQIMKILISLILQFFRQWRVRSLQRLFPRDLPVFGGRRRWHRRSITVVSVQRW